MALYDVGRYLEALTVFQKMENVDGAEGAALVWQGQMLDLLGKREEALTAYQKSTNFDLATRHDQYGIILGKKYVAKRLESPFTRLENLNQD